MYCHLQLLQGQQPDLIQMMFPYCRHPISNDQWVPYMADHEVKMVELLVHLEQPMARIFLLLKKPLSLRFLCVLTIWKHTGIRDSTRESVLHKGVFYLQNGITNQFLSEAWTLLLKSRDVPVSTHTFAGVCRVMAGVLRQNGMSSDCCCSSGKLRAHFCCRKLFQFILMRCVCLQGCQCNSECWLTTSFITMSLRILQRCWWRWRQSGRTLCTDQTTKVRSMFREIEIEINCDFSDQSHTLFSCCLCR